MHRGCMFLVAILDWYSRYVLAWMVSNAQDTTFCLDALEQAFTQGCRAIFNSDQGCQFTSAAFTSRLDAAEVQISMDGRGRVFDNIFIERLWRTVKYEDIYLHDYRNGVDLERGLPTYFQFYNADGSIRLWIITRQNKFISRSRPRTEIRINYYSKLTCFPISVVLTMWSTIASKKLWFTLALRTSSTPIRGHNSLMRRSRRCSGPNTSRSAWTKKALD